MQSRAKSLCVGHFSRDALGEALIDEIRQAHVERDGYGPGLLLEVRWNACRDGVGAFHGGLLLAKKSQPQRGWAIGGHMRGRETSGGLGGGWPQIGAKAMTRHTSNLLDLDGSMGWNCAAVSAIPEPFVFANRLRRQTQLASQSGVGAHDLDGLSDGVLGVHALNFGTFGSFSQAPLGTESFSAMPHASSMDIKKEFADRLNVLLDHEGFPEKHKGRVERLASEFDVSPKTASNWLNGEKLPQYERILEMARRYKADSDWLQTGRGSMRPLSQEERDHIAHLRALKRQDQERVFQVTRVFGEPDPRTSAAA